MQQIKLVIDKIGIDFFFENSYGDRWFYQIHSLYTNEDKTWWDEHLKSKIWYTEEIREQTLKAMDNYLNKKNDQGRIPPQSRADRY